jgi:hypothetical protein
MQYGPYTEGNNAKFDSFIVETSPLYFLILFGLTLCVDFPGYKQAARVALMSFY